MNNEIESVYVDVEDILSTPDEIENPVIEYRRTYSTASEITRIEGKVVSRYTNRKTGREYYVFFNTEHGKYMRSRVENIKHHPTLDAIKPPKKLKYRYYLIMNVFYQTHILIDWIVDFSKQNYLVHISTTDEYSLIKKSSINKVIREEIAGLWTSI